MLLQKGEVHELAALENIDLQQKKQLKKKYYTGHSGSTPWESACLPSKWEGRLLSTDGQVGCPATTVLIWRKKTAGEDSKSLIFHSVCQQEEEAIGTAEGTEGRTNSVFLKMRKREEKVVF